MHRLIAAVVMALFIITTIVAGNYVISDFCDEFNNDINGVIKNVESGDYSGALKKAEQFSDNWEKDKKFLGAFSNHKPIDDVTVNIGELFAGIQTENETVSLSKSYEIIRLINSVKEEQIFKIETLF